MRRRHYFCVECDVGLLSQFRSPFIMQTEGPRGSVWSWRDCESGFELCSDNDVNNLFKEELVGDVSARMKWQPDINWNRLPFLKQRLHVCEISQEQPSVFNKSMAVVDERQLLFLPISSRRERCVGMMHKSQWSHVEKKIKWKYKSAWVMKGNAAGGRRCCVVL